MKLRSIAISLFLLFPFIAFAQHSDSSRLRISLLTCSTGEELYASFGHTAVRIIDSVAGTDIVYNYGTFDGYDENFEIKFMRGKLLYFLSSETFRDFMSIYIYEKRNVEEQVLYMNNEDKVKIQSYLNTNLLPENRAYKYDFYFDNCSTRIRDLFSESLGSGFKFAVVLEPGHNMSYRDITNQYLFNKHWERLGINLLLGSKVDKIMTNTDIMFLPDFLRDGITGSTLNGTKFSGKPVTILEGINMKADRINAPFLIIALLSLITILGLVIPSWKIAGTIMTQVFLIGTGLLGVLILIMWLGTDHEACRPNFNILWALPTNLLLIFKRQQRQYRYAIVAMVCIFLALVLHILRVQQMPLLELSSLLTALLFIYGKIYRNRKKDIADEQGHING